MRWRFQLLPTVARRSTTLLGPAHSRIIRQDTKANHRDSGAEERHGKNSGSIGFVGREIHDCLRIDRVE
jgi:hypothetical protein